MKNLVIGISLAAALSGCAAIRASQAKDKHLEQATLAYKYSQSCGAVWSSARTMLFAQDFQVKSADAASGLTLETEWKTLKGGSATRYLFQGAAPTSDTCQVIATQATKDTKGETTMGRDWHMEWNLIKQVDIAAAKNIEADAEQAGNLARTKS